MYLYHMKKITFSIPSSLHEIEPWSKRLLLSYDSWGALIMALTFLSLAIGQLEDSTQSDQRWTVAWGIIIYLWLAFLVFCGKSADLVGRRWWIWMLMAFFLPFVSIIAALIFRTSNPNRET